jgi:hypothetical protein
VFQRTVLINQLRETKLNGGSILVVKLYASTVLMSVLYEIVCNVQVDIMSVFLGDVKQFMIIEAHSSFHSEPLL